ncbi:MAG: ZIP family metal transporter [Chloroflexota bacterium]
MPSHHGDRRQPPAFVIRSLLKEHIIPRQTQPREAGRAPTEAREEEIGRRWPWLLPLAAGIFLGAAAFEVFPDALAEAGTLAWLWAVVGLIAFVLVRDGLDYIGQRGLAWVATLGIWLHSFLEGAVTATSYSVSLVVGLLVSAGLILHLIPEVGAVIALLTAAGLSLKDAIIRNVITWGFIIVGFLIVYLFLPGLSRSVLGAALAFGAGGFLYLAYLSWREHQWLLAPSIGLVILGALLIGGIRLVT